MTKKGSLNLSIEAIVIVVIAFVVLGLGLGFVKGLFKDITETTLTIQDQIKQQVLDDLSRGDKKLSFPTNEVIVSKKESTVVGVGVKNVKQGNLKYKLLIEAKGGAAVFGTEITDNFLYNTDDEELSPTDIRVIPVRITSETISGTGQFKISVIDVTESEAGTPYDSKTFFITVTS